MPLCVCVREAERTRESFFTNQGEDMFREGRTFYHKIIMKYSATSWEEN